MSKKPDNPNQLRAAAEAQLARAPKPKPRPAEELLHELQVYQIELEMQNEQLRQAQVELEKSRDRYVNLYEFAPVGYITLTDKGLINEINLTGSALFKVERNKLLNKRFGSFVAPEQLDRWNHLFVNMLQHEGSQNIELPLRNGDGEDFRAYLDCKYHAMDDKPVVRITLSDITYWRKAEESLRESRQLLDSIVEHIPVMVFVKSARDLRIELFNRAGEELLGYSRNDLLGKGNYDLWPKEQGDRFTAADRKALASEEVIEIQEEPIQTASGKTRYLHTWKIALRDDDGEPAHLLGISIDITGRKRAEQQLRDLTAHLQTVREEEKAGIAREIHDDLGGTLTAIKMEAYCLAEEMFAHQDAALFLGHTGQIAQLVDNATHAMRRIITGLRPSILDDLGLSAALEWQAVQFSKHTGIECRVNCVADEGCEKMLDKVRSINLFRIFQEALTNVARHSGASLAEVEFHYNDEEIFLSISDNGRGIQEKCADGQIHYGMLGMTERVDQLGGKIEFCNTPGRGLAVTLSLPLAGNRKKGEA